MADLFDLLSGLNLDEGAGEEKLPPHNFGWGVWLYVAGKMTAQELADTWDLGSYPEALAQAQAFKAVIDAKPTAFERLMDAMCLFAITVFVEDYDSNSPYRTGDTLNKTRIKTDLGIT